MKKSKYALAALCAILVLIVFLPGVTNDFVNYDDPLYVYENPYLSDAGSIIRGAFGATFGGNWQPLTILSYGLDRLIWGLDPFGYHLTSIVLHALNTFLAGLLFLRLIGTYRGAQEKTAMADIFASATVALFFGLHPLRVESVVWIAERKDVLYAFFYLLSVLSYLGYASGKRISAYLASIVFFILSLLSKPMAVSLPLVLLLLDVFPLRRMLDGARAPGIKRAVIEKIPFFVLSAGFSFVTVMLQKAALNSSEVLELRLRLLVVLRGTVFYLYKIFAPAGLSPFYPYPLSASFLSAEYLFYFAVAALITAVCVVLFKKSRFLLIVWLYYLVSLAPVLGIVQAGSQSAADRYTYLPGLGPVFIVAAGAWYLIEKHGTKALAALAAVLIIFSAALTMKTGGQIRIWKDSITLWSYEISLYENAAGDRGDGKGPAASMQDIIAYYNRGLAYDKRGEAGRAIEDYGKVISINPRFTNAYVNRGILYGKSGDYEKALDDFNSAIATDPGEADSYFNRAIVLKLMGRQEEAQRDFQTAARLGKAF